MSKRIFIIRGRQRVHARFIRLQIGIGEDECYVVTDEDILDSHSRRLADVKQFRGMRIDTPDFLVATECYGKYHFTTEYRPGALETEDLEGARKFVQEHRNKYGAREKV